MRLLLQLTIAVMPWPLRRRLLGWLYGYELHPTSRIGMAWVYPKQLVMKAHSRIGHLTVCKGMQLIALDEHASIGRLNWISAYPLGLGPHFSHLVARKPQLSLGEHAAITNRHIVDCTEEIRIGPFATVAGFRSQLLTHSIDLLQSRQDAKPIDIGRYCFIGTSCVVLGGTSMPDYSVAGAYALLNKAYEEPYRLYAGVPAKPMGPLDPNMKYFCRTAGYVV